MINKKLIAILTAVSTLAAYPVSLAENEKITAFPGAEGGGMYTSGARDTVKEIYHVTTLADSGVGSLRDAVSQSDRIVVFDVAGNIELKNALNILGSNLTILGQTAPGDGICIKDHTVGVYGDNVILRYLRFRMGDDATVEDDSLGGRDRKNVIIDHCSISWSTDECASFYDNTNFTMQWCIISESLKQSVHAKGSHGYGGIWGGRNASYHHNLIMNHDSRNPRIATAGIDAAYTDVTKQVDLTDLVNNVVYNWGGNSAYGGENGAPVNLVNCYYKPGPATKHTARLYQISAKQEGDTTGTNSLNRPGWGTDIYVIGNYVEGNSEVTNDNTKGIDFDSNTVKYGIWTDSNITEEEQIVHNRYSLDYPIAVQTAQEAYTSVLEKAGASVVRDSVDERLVNEVKTGKATYSNGIINSPSEVGGYPELTGTKSKDSDNDGMPNEWEDKNGLDKFNAEDALNKSTSGYLNIEEYANALADGSFVRDVNYDPDVADYVPETKPEATATPAPEFEKELISSWTAQSGDESKEAGTEFMPGLTAMITLSSKKTDSVNFSDGSNYSFAITSKTNGDWDYANGKATGNALRFKAPQDGVFTLYAYTVSGTKTFYVVPEGATSQETGAVFKQDYTGSSVPILYSVDMKKDDVYYFYIAGSKARFCGAKFEVYKAVATPEPTEAPEQYEKYVVSNFSADENSVLFTVNNVNYNDGGTAIATYYDNTDRLTAVETCIISADKTYTINRGIKKNESVKLFIWNSSNGMIPLAKTTK